MSDETLRCGNCGKTGDLFDCCDDPQPWPVGAGVCTCGEEETKHPHEGCKSYWDVEWEPRPITVKGNRLTLTRLDAEGNPTGEPYELPVKSYSVELEPGDEVTVEVEDFDGTGFQKLKRITMEVSFLDIDPEVLALYMGLPPDPWWWGLLPRKIKTTLKARRLRRVYSR